MEQIETFCNDRTTKKHRKQISKIKGITTFFLAILFSFNLYSASIQLLAESQLEAFIIRLYRLSLEREPDTEGLNFWTSCLEDGTSTSVEIADWFLNSEELTGKNLSDSAYLDILYQTLMGRESDEGGKGYWLNFMENGVSQKGILYYFLSSKEFTDICDSYGTIRGTPICDEARDENLDLTMFISRQFKEILGRQANANELNDWAGQVLSGKISVDIISKTLFESDEFLHFNHNNESYTKILYRSIFGRICNEEELAFWCDFLNGNQVVDGIPVRQWMFEKFTDGEEFQNIILEMKLYEQGNSLLQNEIASSFVWPRPNSFYINSKFSIRVHPILGVQRQHKGVDIRGNFGDQIVSAGNGTVRELQLPLPGQNTGGSGYGNYLVIDHGAGVYTLYGHCRDIYVRKGDTVRAGQVIAEVGSTGLSTGAHLHFEVQINGVATDPLQYFPRIKFTGNI